MSSNFLNAKKGISIFKSDNADVPFINVAASGTTDATTANKLVDSTASFGGNVVEVGDIVYNTTDSTAATVTAIDSDTTLTLNADIIASGKAYTIYKGNQNEGCLVYVGGTGDINCVTAGGTTLLFKNVAVGILGGTCPVQVKKILSTSTSATLLLGLW